MRCGSRVLDRSASSGRAGLQIGALGFFLSQMQNYLIVVPQSLQRYDRSAQSEAIFGVLVNLASIAAALAGGGVPGVIAARVLVSLANVLYLIYLIGTLKVNVAPAWPRRSMA